MSPLRDPAGDDRSERARRRLLDLCVRYADALAEDWLQSVLALPLSHRRFDERPREEVRANVWACLRSFRALLEDDDELPLEQFVSRLASQRLATGFSISAPLLAASQFRGAVARVLRSVAVLDHEPPNEVDVLLAADALILQFERDFTEAFAQRSVLATEERYRQMFEHATEVFVTVDDGGHLTRMNARFEELVGPRRDWVGRPLASAVVPADAGIVAELLGEAFGDLSPRPHQLRFPTATSIRVLSARASRLRVEPGAFAILEDVTDEIARRAQIIQSEKMSSVGQVAASVAHELNNPLAWVMTNLEHIRAAAGRVRRQAAIVAPGALADLDGLEHSASEALAGLDRIRDIVTDLNAYSRSTDRAVLAVSLPDVIDFALRMTHPQVGQVARVERDHGLMPSFFGYPGKLSQVFVNLLVNAAQAMGDARAEGKLVRVTSRHEAGVFTVTVSDTGPGMPSDVAERVFEPFFTTKDESLRSGLGLWVSRKIVEEHQGSMTVESRPGHGTTFTIRMKGLDAPDRSSSERPAGPTSQRSVRAAILFVDDEPMLLSAFVRALGDTHEVLVANSAAAALDLLHEREGRVDVIVCDLLMPGASGMDLYDDLRARFPALVPRVVFMSGGAFTVRSQAFLDRVPNPKITKPITLDALELVILDVLAANRER